MGMGAGKGLREFGNQMMKISQEQLQQHEREEDRAFRGKQFKLTQDKFEYQKRKDELDRLAKDKKDKQDLSKLFPPTIDLPKDIDKYLPDLPSDVSEEIFTTTFLQRNPTDTIAEAKNAYTARQQYIAKQKPGVWEELGRKLLPRAAEEPLLGPRPGEKELKSLLPPPAKAPPKLFPKASIVAGRPVTTEFFKPGTKKKVAKDLTDEEILELLGGK